MAAPELGDDAFEALGLGGFVERDPLPLDMGGITDPRVVLDHAPQQAFAVFERDVQQRSPVEIQEVEGLIDEAPDAALAEFRLEEREVRTAVVVERDDFTIDDGLRRGDPAGR